MDAVKFIKAIKQMLGAGAADSTVQKYISAYKKNDCEGMVKAAEQWAAEHPAKTRQSVFLEQYPKAELDVCGVVTICPAPLSDDYRNSGGGCKHPSTACFECRRKFWLAEVEE